VTMQFQPFRPAGVLNSQIRTTPVGWTAFLLISTFDS
jgi:hypothetical protein